MPRVRKCKYFIGILGQDACEANGNAYRQLVEMKDELGLNGTIWLWILSNCEPHKICKINAAPLHYFDLLNPTFCGVNLLRMGGMRRDLFDCLFWVCSQKIRRVMARKKPQRDPRMTWWFDNVLQPLSKLTSDIVFNSLNCILE
jgi:hypothetical protein